MDELKHGKFIVIRIDAECEEKACVASIYNLMVAILIDREIEVISNQSWYTYLKKAGHLVVSGDDEAVRLSLDLPSLVLIVGDVPAT